MLCAHLRVVVIQPLRIEVGTPIQVAIEARRAIVAVVRVVREVAAIAIMIATIRHHRVPLPMVVAAHAVAHIRAVAARVADNF